MGRRRGEQDGCVRLRRRKDGSGYYQGVFWVYRVTPDGNELKPKQQTVNLDEDGSITQTQAEWKLKEYIRDFGGAAGTPKMTASFGDFVNQKYIPNYLSKKKPVTRRVHGSLLNVHILPELGDMEISEVDYDRLQEFIDRKSRSGLGWHSTRNLKKVLSSVFNFGVKNYSKEYGLVSNRRGISN